VCSEVQSSTGAKLLKDFAAALEGNATIADIRSRVEAFAGGFPMPGFSTKGLPGPQ
jgi:glycine hydroxymethyltransferase